MGHNLEDNRPLGGLDGDSEIRNVAATDSLYNLNVRTAINQANQGDALENVMGNLAVTKYTLPYSGGVWPAGANRCLGGYEDTKFGTLVFFVYNSNNNHQILRYYRNNTDPLNPWGEVQQVMMYDFGWTVDTRITSVSIAYGTPTPQPPKGGFDDASLRGDLLYWCDPVPRKINLTKGNVCGKNKSWVVYTPNTYKVFQSNHPIQLYTTDFTGQFGAVVNIPGQTFDTNSAGMAYLADYINAHSGGAYTAEACECSLTITDNGTSAWNFSLSGFLFLYFPLNWYGTNLVDRFFDHCKWPEMNAPQCLYKQDALHLPNYVRDHVFQFRIEPLYDDLEQAVPGVWSQIAANNMQCDGRDNPAYNYIDVNFNDTELVNLTALVILKKIRFISRELNTVNSKAVIDLEACDFLDYDGTNWYCHFKFYNDIIPNPIAQELADRLFDDVPLTAGAEILVKDRMVFGGTENGYNAPECPVGNYEVQMSPVKNITYKKVTGKIRIMTQGLGYGEEQVNGPVVPYIIKNFYSMFPASRKYPFWYDTTPYGRYIRRGGIFHDISRTDTTPGGNHPFFGGGGFGVGGTSNFGIRAGMETTYDQRTPLAGFVAYAANTEFVTVSKQVNLGGLPVDALGAFDTSTQSNRNAIADFYRNGGDVYSTFELMLPDNGTYVIRLASHWCSVGVNGADVLGFGFAYDITGKAYQQTSTNVWCVVDTTGTSIARKEFSVTLNGSDVDLGEFIVADLAPPFDANISEARQGTVGQDNCFWQPINAYLVSDSNGGSDINAGTFAGSSVEKAVVSYNKRQDGTAFGVNFGLHGSIIPNSVEQDYNIGWGDSCTTDHNGYWFGIGGSSPSNEAALLNLGLAASGFNDGGIVSNFPMYAYQVSPQGGTTAQLIRNQDTLMYAGNVSQYYNKQLTAVNYNGLPGGGVTSLVFGFIAATLSVTRSTCSTNIDGTVVDGNGAPIPAVGVLYENGSFVSTDQFGKYSIVCFGDLVTPNLTNFSSLAFAPQQADNRTVDRLIFLLGPSCIATFPAGNTVNININRFGFGGYTPSNHYLVALFTILEVIAGAVHTLKRGGKYLYGIRYYDSAGRLCSVSKLFEMYIPFETEDLSTYAQVVDGIPTPGHPNGNPFTVPTYIGGVPVLYWSLDNFAPPQFAVFYQLMRTINTVNGGYLQWVVNEVTYVSSVGTSNAAQVVTSYANGNAVAIALSLSNIVSYYGQNPDSQIGYSFTPGDRVRFMYNRDGQLIQGLYDLEITGYDPATLSIAVKAAFLPFEIFSGFMIEIYNPDYVVPPTAQIYYEVGEVFKCTHPGHADNAHSVTSGKFTNGDTYWRNRIIEVDDPVTNYINTYIVNVEDASKSDFYPSLAQDIGRPGIVDPTFVQIFNPSYMRATDTFLPSTGFNGLSSFPSPTELVLEKTLDRKYGQIQRFFFEQNNLVAVMTSKEVSNYINRQTIYNAQNPDGIQASTTDFFGTDFVHENNFGTDQPASCVTNSGNIYGWTNQRANIWRYLQNGELAISDALMINWFKQLSQDGVLDAVAAYDRYHEEYILTYWRKYTYSTTVWDFGGNPDHGIGNELIIVFATLPPLYVGQIVTMQYPDFTNAYITVPGTIIAIADDGRVTVSVPDIESVSRDPAAEASIIYGLPETISWFEGTRMMREKGKAQRWMSFYSFAGEWMSPLNSEMFTFKDGRIWIQDKNPLAANFFGVQYDMATTPVFNEQPELTKVWNALWMLQYQDNQGCNWHSDNIYNNAYGGQLSRIKAVNFIKREEGWYTQFMRDLNDTVATNPIVNGRMLRSSALVCEMRNDYTGKIILYGWRGNYTLSERTSK